MRYRLTAPLLGLLPTLALAQTFSDATTLIHDPSSASATGAAVVDFNGDGRADLYRSGRWYVNEGPSGFTDARADLGIESENEWGAVFGDINDDGRLDVFIILAQDSPLLYRQQADGRFSPVPNDGGIDLDGVLSQGSVWLDFDRDGDLDLFVPDDLTLPRFVRKLRTGQFEDASPLVALPYARQAYGAMAGDFDNDGDPDILIGACANEEDRSRNVLFRNDNVVFTDAAPFYGIDDERAGWAAVWLDIDNDGWLDAFVANMPLGGRPGGNVLFRNDGSGGFEDVSATSGVAGDPQVSYAGAAAADFDNDGWVDLLVTAFDAPPRLFRNDGDGTFTDVSDSAGLPDVSSVAVAVGDVDGDGWVDVYLPSNSGDRLFRNDGGSSHWLRIEARGGASNRFGVGARIEVEAPGMTQIREISAGDGMTTQSHALGAHFGLGGATSATVTVRWPSGAVDQYRNVAADAAYTVVEDGWIAPVGTEPASMPAPRLTLAAPTPNPAPGVTMLRYTLPAAGPVRLTVYDALGREVARLADGTEAAGPHAVRFDGSALPAGVYVVRLLHAAGAETQTLTLLR